VVVDLDGGCGGGSGALAESVGSGLQGVDYHSAFEGGGFGIFAHFVEHGLACIFDLLTDGVSFLLFVEDDTHFPFLEYKLDVWYSKRELRLHYCK